MKTIELEDDLYRYIASQTQDIGESASDILRRLLSVPTSTEQVVEPKPQLEKAHVKVSIAESAPAVPVKEQAVVIKTADDNKSDLPGSIDKLIQSNEFKETSVSVTKFIQILSVLYAEHPTEFEAATDIKGRKRIYFAKSESALLSAGSTTKPRKIEHTPYWVITNTNTGRKRNMITQLMAEMGYPHALIDAVSQSI